MTALPRRLLFWLAPLLLLLSGRVPGQTADADARQVTVFGILASPTDLRTDPKLRNVSPQLHKLLPKHGFRLLDVQTRRLSSGQTVACTLEDGFTASTTLVSSADENGKVQLVCSVLENDATRLETRVSTPPNQLFFCEKPLPDGTRFLIGIGAR